MIIVEEQHDQKSKRQRHENPFSIQFPKVNQPASQLRRVKGFADSDTGYTHYFERTRDMRKSNPENRPDLFRKKREERSLAVPKW